MCYAIHCMTSFSVMFLKIEFIKFIKKPFTAPHPSQVCSLSVLAACDGRAAGHGDPEEGVLWLWKVALEPRAGTEQGDQPKISSQESAFPSPGHTECPLLPSRIPAARSSPSAGTPSLSLALPWASPSKSSHNDPWISRSFVARGGWSER